MYIQLFICSGYFYMFLAVFFLFYNILKFSYLINYLKTCQWRNLDCIWLRRSTERVGTRLFVRGADENGFVANYVETEQIVEVGNISLIVPIFYQLFSYYKVLKFNQKFHGLRTNHILFISIKIHLFFLMILKIII